MALAIRTQGGFCNRLRAIVCGVLWAEDLGLDLEIYWPQEIGHMVCAIEEILDISTIPRLTLTRASYLKSAHQVLNASDMLTVLQVGGDLRIQSYSIFHDEFLKERGLAILRGIQVMPYLESVRIV